MLLKEIIRALWIRGIQLSIERRCPFCGGGLYQHDCSREWGCPNCGASCTEAACQNS